MVDRSDRITEAPTPGNGSNLPAPGGRAIQNNLPLPLSSFVGRAEAMAQVRRLLASTRLLTLGGPGGVGKTRLALEVAWTLLDDLDDGVWWVDLAPLCDVGRVAQTVALALGLPDGPTGTQAAALNNYLRDKDLLLVLDNCEHVIAECAELAEQLLPYSSRLSILATSREPLGIDGESVWSVPPLSLPCLDETLTQLDLAQSEAGQLFLERARASQPDLLVTEAVARAIAQVCCRLDGIPLAIELAAARVRVLSVPQIAARLDDLFRLLTEGSRTALPRHQTFEAAIEWSYDLLTQSEQKVFERLAVLTDFNLAAAEVIASDPAGSGGILPTDVLDLLSGLVFKSLVVMVEGEEVRYRMLATIREYAWQRLLSSGDLERVRYRHLAYYLELAEHAESGLMAEEQMKWLQLLEVDYDNLRAALTWSLESKAGEAGLRLAAALAAFWLRAGYLGEGSSWLERTLDAHEEVGPVRIKALYQAARLAQHRGDHEQALAFATQSLTLSRHLEDRQGMARAQDLIDRITHAQGDRAAASALLQEGLAAEPALPAEPSLPAPSPAHREPPSHPGPRPHEYGLTPREVEVLRLVSRGLTDAQVAERLSISSRTVGKHLQSIYGKLDLSSRSAATRWAMEHDLG